MGEIKKETIPDPVNLFSCDVEDWYQSSFDFDAPISKRVLENVKKCTDLLEVSGVKGTFFIQGLVAKERPEVVKLIESKGHEVASHCFSHKPIYSMSPEVFSNEVRLTNDLLENLTGRKVKGFRAPDFSIFNSTDFAFDVLKENGIEYDSSIFPMSMRRYGNPGCSLGVYKDIKTGLIEVPISLVRLGSVHIPVAGGGYMRVLPYSVLDMAVGSVNKDGRTFVLYCHPYEFDPDEWSHFGDTVPLYRRLHQGIGRPKFPDKVGKIMKKYSFGRIDDYLKAWASSDTEKV